MPIYQGCMNSEQRVRRLRELLAQLERLPASADRERMLREVRGRLVDVDTGVPPRAMMPVDAEETRAADPAPRTVRTPRSRIRVPAETDQRARAVPPPAPAKPVDATGLDAPELLSLEDSAPAPRRDAQPERRSRPWTRGLRG